MPAYSNRVSNGKKVWCRSTRCVTVRSHLRCLRSSKCIPSPLPDSVHVSANASTATSSVPLCSLPARKDRGSQSQVTACLAPALRLTPRGSRPCLANFGIGCPSPSVAESLRLRAPSSAHPPLFFRVFSTRRGRRVQRASASSPSSSYTPQICESPVSNLRFSPCSTLECPALRSVPSRASLQNPSNPKRITESVLPKTI